MMVQGGQVGGMVATTGHAEAMIEMGGKSNFNLEETELYKQYMVSNQGGQV